MLVFSIVVFILYFGMAIYILPTLGFSFDLYERKFRLLTYGLNYAAIAWLVIAFTYSFVSFVAILVAVGVMNITDKDSSWSNFIVREFFGGAMLVATLYFLLNCL